MARNPIGKSRIIRVSEATYQRLQSFAVPLVDRPNDVVSRVLDMAELTAQQQKQEETPPTKPATEE